MRGAECLKGNVSKSNEWTRDVFIIGDGMNIARGVRKLDRELLGGTNSNESNMIKWARN